MAGKQGEVKTTYLRKKSVEIGNMAENGLNLVICFLIFQTGCGIPLPGLERPVMSPDINTKIEYQSNQQDGSSVLPHMPTTSLPHPSVSTAIVSKDTDLTSLLQHMSAIEFLRLLALGTESFNTEALNQAVQGSNKVDSTAKNSGQSAVARPVQPTGQVVRPGLTTGQQQQIHQSANQQQQTEAGSGYNSAHGQMQTGNTGSISAIPSQGGMNPNYMGAQTPNQVPHGQYYNLPNQQRPASNGQPSGGSMSPNGMAAQPSPGQTMLGIGMGTGYQPNNFNHAQQYTNPVVMLTGGMASRTNENPPSTGNNKDKATGNPQPALTGQAVFNPDQLMNSLLSSDSSSFNPDKFTASQSYISTNSWSSPYTGKPTGYSGMFMKDDKNKQASEGPKPKQDFNAMQQQMPQTQYNAKMNFVPTNMMLPGGASIDTSELKFSFDPDKINQFFGTFRPGQIAPSVDGQKIDTGSTEHTEQKSENENKEKEKSRDDKEGVVEQESGAHAQQEQAQSHQMQLMSFNTNQGNFAQPDPMPKYFMGNFGGSNPFYFQNNDEQYVQASEHQSHEFVPGRIVPRRKRSVKEGGQSKKVSAENVMRVLMSNIKFFEKFFQHDVANQEQVEEKKVQTPTNRDSHQNSSSLNSTVTTEQPTSTTPTQVTTTLPSSSIVTVVRNVTITNTTSTKPKVQPTTQPGSSSGGFNPDAVNAGQAHQGGAPVPMFGYGNPSGFNPNSANTNTGFNPAMSPGMTATAFSGMQFGQLGPKLVNMSSKVDPFGMNMNANFDPSKFNSVHMNFDMNSQLGIMGNPNGQPSGSQAFSGGYDPMKTNMMAMQNPFNPGSANGSSSNTGMNQFGGGNNAFIKPFNPNTLNEALFGKIENGPSNNTNGGSGGDFSSFYLGMGAGSEFGGSFDPSRVNNAVFNPDEVNKIRIHFDPSEMLERNPGYDKHVASTYNFDPNKVNNMQGQNVVPPFLGQNPGQGASGSADNKTKANSFGQPSEFQPGMLSGGGDQGIKFDPNRYNNVTLQMNPMAQTNQIQSLINPANNSLSFDPTAVNNMQMSYNPYQIIGGNNLNQLSTPGNGNKAPPSGQVQEFNTNHALPVNNVPTLQGGNKDGST